MNRWYRFIRKECVSEAKDSNELDMLEEDREMVADCLELDALMQVICPSSKETGSGN